MPYLEHGGVILHYDDPPSPSSKAKTEAALAYVDKIYKEDRAAVPVQKALGGRKRQRLATELRKLAAPTSDVLLHCRFRDLGCQAVCRLGKRKRHSCKCIPPGTHFSENMVSFLMGDKVVSE